MVVQVIVVVEGGRVVAAAAAAAAAALNSVAYRYMHLLVHLCMLQVSRQVLLEAPPLAKKVNNVPSHPEDHNVIGLDQCNVIQICK